MEQDQIGEHAVCLVGAAGLLICALEALVAELLAEELFASVCER
jgi:hypothetical protein